MAKLRLVTPSVAGDPTVAARDRKRGRASDREGESDATLVGQAREGSSAVRLRAQEGLYRRHAAFAFNLAARIAGSTVDVEDVVHDAFLRAFDNLDNLRNPAVFRSWLGSIVVHAMRSRLRRARWLRLFGLGHPGDPVDIDALTSRDASPGSRAELAQVYALLRTMPADDRIAWTLRYVEGHDLKATAELCDCSLATVKRRIRRAQRFIETHFVDHGEGAAPPSRRRSQAPRGPRSDEGGTTERQTIEGAAS
ncbi:MAG: sigma-70 family RNA polymerase sigma factor [Myxococcota bacterium]